MKWVFKTIDILSTFEFKKAVIILFIYKRSIYSIFNISHQISMYPRYKFGQQTYYVRFIGILLSPAQIYTELAKNGEFPIYKKYLPTVKIKTLK